MNDIFTVRSSVFPSTTKVAGFRGSEGLSRPYVFEILLMMTNDEAGDFDMEDAIGAKTTLTAHRGGEGAPFVFHGILSALELVHEFGKRAVFRARLVPQLWLLTQTFHSRIFTKVTIPDMIKAVLEDSGLTSDDYVFRLLKSYKPEEHVCQYRESNFDFISRWMEREGLYYFFEHGDDQEKLVITDDKSSHSPLIGRQVRYFPQTGSDVTAGESFRSFTCRHASLPGSVRLKDYDYGKPALEITGSAPVSPTGMGEISVYGARFFSPTEGARVAKIRSEELLARQVVFQAVGSPFHLRAGYTFEVDDHPRAKYNAGYLAIGVEHYGSQATGAPELVELLGFEQRDVYRVEVTAIAASVQFRAESKTTWPRIYSFENATVDGPATSEYAQIDEQGRYAVKFKFDEGTLKGGQASTMVRMMQPHGGGIEGFHFPLRKDTEVVVTFLGGDADRPCIAGVVPNALTPSPVTSGNYTKNVIQTGGRNRFELEDQAGQQRITLSTPHTNSYVRMGSANEIHTMIIHTDGPTLIDAGLELDVTAGAHKHETIEGEVTEIYKDSKTETVTLAVSETYNTTKTEKVPNGQVDETYKAQKTTVTNLREGVFGTQKTTVHGTVTEIYEGHHDIKVTTGGRTDDVTGAFNLTVHGAVIEVVDETKEETVTGTHKITTGARTEHVKGDYGQTIDGTWTQTTGNVVDYWTANKSSHTYGFSNSINIGGKASLDMSLNAIASLSAAIALTAGLKLEAKASASITLSAACDINAGSVAFNQETLKIDTKGCGIKNVGTAIQLAAITIFA
jgi:type VI secretion system secreted protein VgrG